MPEQTLYLDSSALVKLIVKEPESSALAGRTRGQGVISSELALTEVPRAIWRVSSDLPARKTKELQRGMEQVLSGIALLPLRRDQLVKAGSFREPYLRALDAIHLAAAIELRDDLDAFVTYDHRQRQAAADAGLTVLSP